MKKWIVPLLIGVAIGCIIGFVMGLLALSLFNIKPNNEASYGVLEIVYYLVTPIGVLATFCAVAVALWGNEFKNYLFREKSVSSVTNNFVEVIKDENDPNPEASRYECNLSVKNCSAHEISDCCVFLLELSHGESENSKLKKIKSSGIPARVYSFCKSL